MARSIKHQNMASETGKESDFLSSVLRHPHLSGIEPRAKGLRKNGFTKMAEEHEQIAQTIERARQQQTK
jgi:hypothetical protein